MGILQQVKQDAAFLQSLIASLSSDNPNATVTMNGVSLAGKDREEAIERARLENGAELKRLEMILESGVIPEKYYSIITKQNYYPSSEEQQQRLKALPHAKHTFFAGKLSRKQSGKKLSKFIVVQDDATQVTQFFIEHNPKKEYPRGSQAARVKQGYLDEANNQPKYAIKIYNQNLYHGDTIHELRLAMRAAYCYKQLGREGYSFRLNNKQFMVTEWLQGANLHFANRQEVQSIPIPRRIVMAISLLRELGILHKQGLIHNDIKPSNVIVNYGELRFVDLDSVRPKNEKPHLGVLIYTEPYLPPQLSYDATYSPKKLYLEFNEKTDIYALGLTLAWLFQEIYTPNFAEKEIKVNGGSQKTYQFKTVELLPGEKHNEHPHIAEIIKNMVLQENSSLVTTDDYINAFKTALLTYPDHEQYLKEDRLVNSGQDISSTDGEKAFREIEVELLGYNQRCDAVKTKTISM